MSQSIPSLGRRLILLLLAGSLAGAHSHELATQELAVINSRAFSTILDAVFPDPEYDARRTRYIFMLRFSPSRQCESQILVTVAKDGAAEARLRRVSGTCLWTLANQYLEKNGREDVGQIAAQARVEQHTIPLPAQIAESWRALFLRAVRRSADELDEEYTLRTRGQVEVALDGTEYDLRFSQNSRDCRWQFLDDDVDASRTTGRAALVRWMNDVRLYCEAHASH